MILWLSDKDVYDHPPASLVRLVARGLELRLTEDLGPHKKYYPLVESEENIDALTLITADDDLMYGRKWLQKLISAATAFPDSINAYRAHRLTFNERGELNRYNSWIPCWRSTPELFHFSTGGMGTAYPHSFPALIRERGRAFMQAAPFADDVWLHYIAAANDIKTRQLYSFPRHFPAIPPDIESGTLSQVNVYAGGNDRQISATYDPGTLSKLFTQVEEYGRALR
ncbi:hypothetical protein ACX9R5_18320 [Rathayibacter sp. CAU 1779]